MILSRATTKGLGISVLLFALTACGPTGGGESPTTPPTAPELPSSIPTVSPTPTAQPPALAHECKVLLNPESLATFAGTGFGIPDATDITAYVDKTRAEGNPLALFVDWGGLLCPVTNGTRVAELFGYSPIVVADAATQKARLLAEGLTQSTHLGGELYSDTTGSENVVFEYLFIGGYWFCAVDIARLDEVVANSGAGL